LDPADRAAAQKHIEECKAKVSDEDKAQVAAPQPLVLPMPQPMAQPVPQVDVTTRIALQPRPSPPRAGRGCSSGGIVTGAVGVAAVVAGVVFNLKANSLVDEMQTTIDAYTSSKNSSQNTYKTLAWVATGWCCLHRDRRCPDRGGGEPAWFRPARPTWRCCRRWVPVRPVCFCVEVFDENASDEQSVRGLSSWFA